MKAFTEIKNTKTGKIGNFVCQYRKTSNNELVFQVNAPKKAVWLAKNCEVIG